MTDVYTNETVTDNLSVVVLWKAGKNARNLNRTLYCIDDQLFSYTYKIGHRTKAGVCVVADLDLSCEPYSLNKNTEAIQRHIALAKRYADTIFHQLVSESSPLFKDEVPF
jgi:hypothetical protein